MQSKKKYRAPLVCYPCRFKSNDVRKFDLIVIGGGISGLSTVHHLLSNEFTGTIGLIEARNRFGGRIWTRKALICGETIEVGANWIHGTVQNPIYEIMCKTKDINPNQPNKKLYRLAKAADGEDMDQEWMKKVQETFAKILKETEKFYNNTKEAQNYDDSMGKYLMDRINNWIENEARNAPNMAHIKELFNALIKNEIVNVGSNTLDEVSLKYYNQYKQFLGDDYLITRGYFNLIQTLLEEIKQLDNRKLFNTFLQHRIIKIKWPGTNPSSSEPIIRIECMNGVLFECKHLVMTISLGCLKKNIKNLFDPPLPQMKIDCIERLGFNVVNKIFLEYRDKNPIIKSFTKDGVLFDEIFVLWNVNNDTENEEFFEMQWFHKIYSFHRITEHCILAWISGEEAMLLETLNEDDVNSQLTEQFRNLFNNSFFPKASNVIISRWGSDQYSLGSYSYIQTGSSPQDIEDLAKPIFLNKNSTKVLFSLIIDKFLFKIFFSPKPIIANNCVRW